MLNKNVSTKRAFTKLRKRYIIVYNTFTFDCKGMLVLCRMEVRGRINGFVKYVYDK